MKLLDASALLAVLQNEPGVNAVVEAMPESAISAANLSEVAAKLVQHGVPAKEVFSILKSFDLEVLPVDEDIALQAGALFAETQKFGLCLGDRLCLATAISARLSVLTADRSWAKVDAAGLKVELIR